VVAPKRNYINYSFVPTEARETDGEIRGKGNGNIGKGISAVAITLAKN
jgi:hypothetical protein